MHYHPGSDDSTKVLSSYEVHDILCHSDGTIWVGTKYGLDVIDPQLKTTRTIQFGMDVNTQVASLVEADDGSLWLGTQNGLLHYNPTSDTMVAFTKNDGLINTVYSHRACFKDSHGVTLFWG